MPAHAPRELFRSADLVVRQVGGHSPERCVVTFDSWTDNRTLDRPGFGEHFLSSRGLDAIHVISRDNDWYQYPDMLDAMATVHAATRGYDRVITYGSSMGAYAALRFAGVAGAHCALAMSPQFSIDATKAPFEHRWHDASLRFKPFWEASLPLPVLSEAYVVYDPYNLDMQHVALLEAEMAFTHVKLGNAGHTVMGFLLDLNLLHPMVLAICHASFDPAALIAEARRRRGQSPQYLSVLAERSSPKQSCRRIKLLQEAVRISPTHAGCMRRLADEFSAIGRHEEAIAMNQASLIIEPANPDLMWHYSRTLEANGDLSGALAVMEKIEVVTGGALLYKDRLLDLSARVAALVAPPAPQPVQSPAPSPGRLKAFASRLLQAVSR